MRLLKERRALFNDFISSHKTGCAINASYILANEEENYTEFVSAVAEFAEVCWFNYVEPRFLPSRAFEKQPITDKSLRCCCISQLKGPRLSQYRSELDLIFFSSFHSFLISLSQRAPFLIRM